MCSVSYIFIIIIGIKIVNWPKAMGHQALGVMGSIDIRCLREGNMGEGGGRGIGSWWCKGVEKRDGRLLQTRVCVLWHYCMVQLYILFANWKLTY